MRDRIFNSFIVILFSNLFLGVLITNFSSPSECLLVCSAYMVCFVINRTLLKTDLFQAVHLKILESPKSELYFRGKKYENMTAVEVEKKYLQSAGARKRVFIRRLTSAAALMVILYFCTYALRAAKINISHSTMAHLFSASAFLPVESFSHYILPLGLNILLVSIHFAWGEPSPTFLLFLYVAACFMSLGAFALQSSKDTDKKISKSITSWIQIAFVWGFMASILYLVLPGPEPKALMTKSIEKLEETVHGLQKQLATEGLKAMSERTNSPSDPESRISAATEGQIREQSKLVTEKEIKEVRKKIHETLTSPQVKDFQDKVGDSDVHGTGEGNIRNGSLSEDQMPEGTLMTEEELSKIRNEVSKYSPKENPQGMAPENQVQSQQAADGQTSKNATSQQLSTQKLEELKELDKKLAQAESLAQLNKDAKKEAGEAGASNLVPSAPEKIEEKIEIPDLSRWLPIFKFLIFSAVLLGIFRLVLPFTEKNNLDKAREPKLTKKDRLILRRVIGEAKAQNYFNAETEVIDKYHVFLKVMEHVNRGRPESLPPHDYSRWLGSEIPKQALPVHQLTEVFCDVLYGEKLVDTDQLVRFRKSFDYLVAPFVG